VNSWNYSLIIAAGEQSARVARLKDLEKDNVDFSSDLEKEDQIEKIASPAPSTLDSASRNASQSDASSSHETQQRRVIRFEDGDPENPDNWGKVCTSATLINHLENTDISFSGKKFMLSSLLS
jgi:hypothetical protein